MSTRLTVAISAGGKSSRMGTDKAFVEMAGKPLIAHMLERVADLGQQNTVIITNRPTDYAHLGLPLYGDVIAEKGALGGIYSALHHSQTEYTLVLACDMPFVNTPLLQHMIGLCQADPTLDVVVPRVHDYPEGLHAVYHQRCLVPIRNRLEADKLKVIGFYPEVKVRYLEEPEWRPFDPQGLTFFDLDTPEELEIARRMLGEHNE